MSITNITNTIKAGIFSHSLSSCINHQKNYWARFPTSHQNAAITYFFENVSSRSKSASYPSDHTWRYTPRGFSSSADTLQ